MTPDAPALPPIDEERSARLAALAEQIAAMERSRPVRVAADPVVPSAMVGEQTRERPEPPDLGASRPRGGGRWPTRPGGHPEDPPGDPEVVAKAICLRLLTIAPRPRAGLRQALLRKEIPAEVIERVLDRLTEVGLIDDAAYAAAFVRTKHRDRGLGRTALDRELRRLGIDQEASVAAVTQVDDEAEQERAAALVAKRVDAAMSAGPVAARRRLMGLLARRGYSAEVAGRAVDQALQGHASDDS